MIWICGIILLIVLIWLYLIFPARSSREQRAPFEKRSYAHRGLYEKDQSVPENSLPAFRRAVEAGYGAELDVQMTKDGQVVVFHDDTLERACGRDGQICDFTFAELQAFPLFGSTERIPLFSGVLEIFSGRQPLIVELKHCPNQKELCAAAREMLGAYKGPGYRGLMPAYVGWMLSRVLFNAAARPQFIAFKLAPKPLSVRLCEALGAMKVCWTAREADRHEQLMQENDAVIFEGYRPS